MKIISPEEVEEAYKITEEAMRKLLRQGEIDPKFQYPIHYTQQNLERVYPNLTTDQDEINHIMRNIHKGFRLYAPRLDFVTDSLLFEDVKDKSFYVIEGKITEMFIDRTTTMREVPMGKIGNQGIFFIGDNNGAKKLYSELEKWVSEYKDLSEFY